MRRQVLKDCVVRLDERDDRIIGALQSNGRLTNVELARKVGMSESSCLRRTRALEDLGVIKGYAAVVDSKRAGYELIAFLMVDLDQRRETDAKAFFDMCRKDPRVVECVAVTGSHDVVLKVVVRDIEELGNLTMTSMLGLPSVLNVRSCIAVRNLKPMRAFSL
jgi:Lrp/AsnC family leucine-responsive transcriptional regulator